MAILLLLLTGCGKKETAPTAYTVGENSVPSLDTIMAEGEGVFASSDGPIPDYPEDHLFYYRHVTAPKDLALRYQDKLLEEGFVLIDENNEEIEEADDVRERSGTILLGKPAAEGTGIFRVIMGWSQNSCSVQTAVIEGEIAMIPEEPDPEEGPSPTTLPEQVEYFRTMSPSELGLTGSTMEDYHIFPTEGLVEVDDITCRQINVYTDENTDGGHAIVGTYLLSLDEQHLFKLNLLTNEIETLK